MKKSELRQLIREVVFRKLSEVNDQMASDNSVGSDQSSDAADSNQQAANADPTLSAKQKELAKQQKNLEKLTNIVKQSESNIARREETIKKANQKDQFAKDRATRKQSPIISKINALQKDISKKTGEA